VIRLARPEDAAAIATVHVRSWQEAYQGLMPADFLANLSVQRREEQWKRSLEFDQIILVCEEGSEVVGFASAGKSPDDDLPPYTAELYTIYLLAKVWDKGFGKALYQDMVNELRARGFKELSLWVLDTNTRAQTFYQGMDLHPDGQKKSETWQNDVILQEVRYRGII
jgi:ribosomal protein S18 acetylase RimI-like enzyme